jgi:protein-disulfide isomerase
MNRGLLLGAAAVVGTVAVVAAQATRSHTPEPISPAPTDTAAVVAGTSITTRQLDEKLGGRLIQLRMQEYRLRKGVLDEIVTTTLLEREAAARQTSTAELVATEIEAKAKPVTDEEARAVLDSARDRMGNMSEAEALKSISEGMRRQRVAQRRTELAASLKAKHGVRLLLESPRVKIDPPSGPSVGPADALVTVVEFSDFQCPYCGREARTLKDVLEKYKGRVRLVFQDFPLSIHKDAPKAAEAAACAGDQGKFWEMHDQLFQNQDKLTVPDLKRHATSLGLDAQSFSTCLDSSRHAADWKRTMALGQGYGVSGTPAFFVNGVPVFGAVPIQEFTSVIDEELTRAGRASAGFGSAPRESQR